jgi:MSHA biogenesis protein MshP
MSRQTGFALPSAIFLLVILALLGAFMLTLSNTQHLTSAQDVQGVRAYRAARMGLEWMAANLCGAATGCTSPLTACPAASTTLDVNPDQFTVVVTCVRNTAGTDYKEAGPTGDVVRHIYWVTSTATSGGTVGSLGYVERSLNAFVEFPN